MPCQPHMLSLLPHPLSVPGCRAQGVDRLWFDVAVAVSGVWRAWAAWQSVQLHNGQAVTLHCHCCCLQGKQHAICAASSCPTLYQSFALPACRARGMTVRQIGLTSCRARTGAPTSSWTTTLPPARSESPPVTAFICKATAVCSALQSHDQPEELRWLGLDAHSWCCSPCVHGKAAGKT